MAMNLRLAREDDAAAVADIYRPIVSSTQISFEIEPPDSQEMRRRIQETLVNYPWLICEEDRLIVGYAYASRHRARSAYGWSVDSSAYVHSSYRKRGIGRALYQSLFGILAAQGYFNVYAGITLPNAASVSLHESLGFKPVGVYRNVGYKLGEWHDVGWWQLGLHAPAGEPCLPLKLGEVQRKPVWPEVLARGVSSIREL